jgi:hypothetical protein
MSKLGDDIPDEYLCPITYALMTDPVNLYIYKYKQYISAEWSPLLYNYLLGTFAEI